MHNATICCFPSIKQMAVWDFSVLCLGHFEVIPGGNLRIHHGNHGTEQILQNCEGLQVSSYVQKVIHHSNSVGGLCKSNFCMTSRCVCVRLRPQTKPTFWNLLIRLPSLRSLLYAFSDRFLVLALFYHRDLLLEHLQSV